MNQPPEKIPVRVKPATVKKQRCLNLRMVEERRWQKILAEAVGIVDLKKLTAKYRQAEAQKDKAKRDRLISEAKHLLDLSLKKQTAVAIPKKAEPIFLETKIEISAAASPSAAKPVKPSVAVAPPARSFRAPNRPAAEPIFSGEVIFPLDETTTDTAWSEPLFPAEPDYSRTFSGDINFLAPNLEPAAPGEPPPRQPELPRAGFWALQRQIVVATRRHHHRGKRSLAVFTILAMLLTGSIGASAAIQKTLDAQGPILAKATAAAGTLKTAAANLKQQKFIQAVSDFERSAQYFQSAKGDIASIGALTTQLLRLIPKGRSALSLVAAGQELAQAGESFTTGISRFRSLGSIFSAAGSGEQNLGQALAASRADFATVATNLDQATQNLNQVSVNSLPDSFRDDFNEAEEIVTVLQGATDYFLNSSDQLAGILGVDGPKRYLVLLANNDETRGSLGGFPGSYLIMDCDGGRIKNLEFHDIYEIRGQKKEAVAPPKQLQLITENFEIQDAAGWFLDYRTTAQKAMEYYQLSDVGTTVDGVFTISSQIIPDLLKITGPIQLPQYNVTIDRNNYLETIESEVESVEARQTQQPKKIVEAFFNNLLSKLLTQQGNNWLGMLDVLDTALQEKKILLYFADPKLEEFAYQNNAAGELKDADNYLAVYSYNIGGGKTDRDITENIRQMTSLDPNGTLKNQVEITRAHQPQNRMSAIKNVSWIRVALPMEAEVKEVVGFDKPLPPLHPAPATARPDPVVADIENSAERLYDGQVWVTTEDGKKVVGFWLTLEPGTQKTVRVAYDVPQVVSLGGMFNEAAGLTSLVQVQPGKNLGRVDGQIYGPADFKLSWQEGKNSLVSDQAGSLNWVADQPLSDIVISAVWEKQ